MTVKSAMRSFLCIDTAKSSGWCFVADNKIEPAEYESGRCDAFDIAVHSVCSAAVTNGSRCILILEKPSHGNRTTLVGLGQAHGAWLAAWYAAGGKKSRVKRVYPATWRSELFGDTAKMPLREKLMAQHLTGKVNIGPDESAAVCLAEYCRRVL